MSAVRNLINDLVDRRLWPVAIALLGALVAVPVLLGGGATPAPAPAAPFAQATATAGASHAAISLDTTTTTTPQDHPGPVRNPFAQHKVPPPAPTPAPAPPAPSTATPSTSTPAASTPVGGGAPVVTTPIVPGSGGGRRDTTVADVWRVNLRFGDVGNQRLHRDIPRLTPLPSSTDPFFVFLGVLSDGKTAVFLVSSDATATGDGKCRPNPAQCDTIEMRAGDTEFFDVAQGNAGVTQYELDLVKVFHTTVTGKAAIAKASRVSADGKNALHELHAEGQSIGDWRYIWSAKRGVLVRRHHLSVAVTASSASTGQPAAAHSSGMFGPVWTG